MLRARSHARRTVRTMIGYELWETTTANLIASYDDEAEALRAVAQCVHQYGAAVLDTVVLVRVDEDDEDGRVEEVAAGAGLLARATSVTGHGGVTAGSVVVRSTAGGSSGATSTSGRFVARDVEAPSNGPRIGERPARA